MAGETGNGTGFLDRHYHVLRRLHSLTGIVPIGVFLIAHLVTNSSLAWGRFALRGQGDGLSVLEGGAHYFQHEVTYINTSVPHLFLIEVTLWVSIAFHAALGFYYAATGKRNTERYAYQDNWRYTLQRWSGYIGILLIFYHIATLRWGWSWLTPANTAWSHEFAASTLTAAIRGDGGAWTAIGLVVALFYFVGVSLLVFHFANGLWTAAITWGLTISEGAQRRWGYVCTALGAALMLAAWSALGAALVLNYNDAVGVESRLIADEHGEEHLQLILEERNIILEADDAAQSDETAQPDAGGHD